MEQQTHKLSTLWKKKEATDVLEQKSKKKGQSGSTWMNTKGRSYPQPRGNWEGEKNRKTNLDYVTVSLKVILGGEGR